MKSFARFFGLKSEKPEISAENPVKTEKLTEEPVVVNDIPVEIVNKNDVQYLNIGDIVPNPFQPRKTFNDEALRDLAASIQEFGVIQPLLVRNAKNQQYELVAGERRLRASKLVGLEKVPAIIKELTDKEMAELAMIENLQREDLHFLEEAEGFHQLLVNFGFTQDELAKRMGKSQSTIANKLRLLKLSDTIRKQLYECSLTERHARALLKLTDEIKQLEALSIIKEKGLNVRESEMLIQEIIDEISREKDQKVPKQNVVRIIRDVRIFLNTIHNVVGEMKKSGLKVKVNQEQDDDYITVKMVIPKRKK
ncbi:nucleoid occlusion protein [Anaerosinus massiliensis]|uniref:nucleoid occlusion protein n=1 Tax=Massilibacillus massiliensis TaxID=1806837 RepID=UPI000A9BEA1F|nr:nucleoid occlusion protein [Massilibacillus massiliensis]